MDSEGPETIDMVVSDWIQATISAIPGGNRAGQNTDTYPLHVVAVTQDNHRGASAVGTFIDPVRDNGAGLGAGHQTGWTGLVAKLIQQSCKPTDHF